jgi:hypothetical protein
LSLLDEPGPEPLLRDYPEEASNPDGDPDWKFPGQLSVESVVAEAKSLLPLWHRARTLLNKTTVGISGLTPDAAVEYIDRYHSADPMPNPKGMARVSRARSAIDDIKVFYIEAAFANGGRPSSLQLNDWFWKQTLAGRMILDFQECARLTDDRNLNLIADSLVPPERTDEYS